MIDVNTSRIQTLVFQKKKASFRPAGLLRFGEHSSDSVAFSNGLTPVRREQIDTLLRNLGLGATKNYALYHRALTDMRGIPSDEPSRELFMNKRLAFLGDAVLELKIRELMNTQFPESEYSMGDVNEFREHLVGNQMLTVFGEQMGLESFIIRGQEGGKDNPKRIADALEALVYAFKLDGKEAELDKLLERWFVPEMKRLVTPTNVVRDDATLAERLPDWVLGEQQPRTNRRHAYLGNALLRLKIREWLDSQLPAPRYGLSCLERLSQKVMAEMMTGHESGSPSQSIRVNKKGERNKIYTQVYSLKLEGREKELDKLISQWLESSNIKQHAEEFIDQPKERKPVQKLEDFCGRENIKYNIINANGGWYCRLWIQDQLYGEGAGDSRKAAKHAAASAALDNLMSKAAQPG